MLDDHKAMDILATSTVGAQMAGNRLLEAMAVDDVAYLLAERRLEATLPGQVLLEVDQAPADIIFPGAGTVVSLLAMLPGRKPVETAMIGAEGALGALFGPQQGSAGFRAQVLTGGPAIRVPAARLGDLLARSSAARGVMAGYHAALLAQVQTGVGCASLHAVESRAARWMLELQDRLGERSLPVTQEALADLLGVRRTTITRVVAALEARGLVRHRRGRIIVMDRVGLEGASCECHAMLRGRFKALAPELYPGARGISALG